MSRDTLGFPPWLSPSLRPASHSDLFLLPEAARFAAGTERVAVACEDRPDFVFGNYLMVPSAPSAIVLRRHLDEWSSSLRARGVRDLVVQWEEGPEGLALAVDGWTLDRSIVLERRHPFHAATGDAARVTQVPLSADLDRVLALLQEGFGTGSRDADFVRWRLGEYARLVEAGRGEWLAVLEGDTMVATCGVFRCGGVTRVQELVTAPGARRRGYASALCRTAFRARPGVPPPRTVAVAEPGSAAELLYRSLGFETAGWQFALIRLL